MTIVKAMFLLAIDLRKQKANITHVDVFVDLLRIRFTKSDTLAYALDLEEFYLEDIQNRLKRSWYTDVVSMTSHLTNESHKVEYGIRSPEDAIATT